MKILVTGNPNYDGLASGIFQIFKNKNIEFISRFNNWNLFAHHAVAEYAKDFDVFINSTYVPNEGQINILKSVYEKFQQGHIINISSTVVYWNNQKNLDYYNDKVKLENLSKTLSLNGISGSPIKVSCIAFGELDTSSQRSRNDNRNKINVYDAATIIEQVIESKNNISYLNLDPIQIM
jgi:short-subunit dehydrogenase